MKQFILPAVKPHGAPDTLKIKYVNGDTLKVPYFDHDEQGKWAENQARKNNA